MSEHSLTLPEGVIISGDFDAMSDEEKLNILKAIEQIKYNQ